jgi:hypothetical protein
MARPASIFAGLNGVSEEETQGNGGKAYMFRTFSGLARILGVADRTRNCKGFDGPAMSTERGTPGFIPSVAEGREVRDVDWSVELQRALEPYGLEPTDLPSEVQESMRRRRCFTLVEGNDPTGLSRGRIEAPDLLLKVLRHEQSTLALQQMRVYAIQNGITLNEGKPLTLEAIRAYPGLEGPFINGFLAKEEGRIYSLTAKGLAATARLRRTDDGTDRTVQAKVGRELHAKIKAILDNQVFSAWMKDHEHPRHFRDAGYFWGLLRELRLKQLDSV